MSLASLNPCFGPKNTPSSNLDPPQYRRREPETTALYQIVQESLEPFLQYTREDYAKPLSKYVERELRRFLTCGVLSKGFTRIRCTKCSRDMLVAFSCGARKICREPGA